MLWPVHFVGVLAQGRFGGPVGPSYAVGVGNGRGHILDEVQMTADANNQRAVVVSFGVNPDAAPGLSVSASGYFDCIPAEGGSLRERDAALSGSYVRGPVEVRTEWSRMMHTTVASRTEYVTTGWYALMAYRLSGRLARIKPYVMIDGLDAAEGEAFFEDVRDEDALGRGPAFRRQPLGRAQGRLSVGRGNDRADRFGTVRAQLAVNF